MNLSHNKEPQGQNKKIRESVAKFVAITLFASAGAGLLGSTEAGASTPHNSKERSVLRALTKDIANLYRGGIVDVTAAEVKIPGPINNAGGEPIIFENGKGGTYYAAYTQEHKPDFHLSPAETASTMAIVDLGAHYSTPLTEAHLDKAGTLVNENEVPVGYSTGGDSSGKGIAV